MFHNLHASEHTGFECYTLEPWLVTPSMHLQVNQLPGAAAFASKIELVTASHTLPFLPQSFRFPEHQEKFRNASSENPEVEWLVKGKKHRGVQFLSSADEAQEVIGEGSDSFVQQLVRPYLIDG